MRSHHGNRKVFLLAKYVTPSIYHYSIQSILTVDSIQALKLILDDFSLATGLEINFHKSTFVPMNVPVHIAAAMAAALGCSTATFPQTYLGLPLSTQAQGFGLPTPDHIL